MCSPFTSQAFLHINGQLFGDLIASTVHLVAPPPDFLMESTLAAATSSHPRVVSRLSSAAFACSFPRAPSRIYLVRWRIPLTIMHQLHASCDFSCRCAASESSGRRSLYHCRMHFCSARKTTGKALARSSRHLAASSSPFSGSWTYGEGETREAGIPAFRFDEARSQQAQQQHAGRTVVVAVGIVRGHVGHFSHFLVSPNVSSL